MIHQLIYTEEEKLSGKIPKDVNLLVYKIIQVHAVYDKIREQLQHLKRLTTLNSDISKRLQTYFEIKGTDDVSIVYMYHRFAPMGLYDQISNYIMHE